MITCRSLVGSIVEMTEDRSSVMMIINRFYEFEQKRENRPNKNNGRN